MKKKKALLLLGGGLDSTSLLLTQKEKYSITGLFFRYGQKTESSELRSCRYFCSKYRIKLITKDLRGLSDLKKEKDYIVEGRNSIFIIKAIEIAREIKATEIMLGFHLEPRGTKYLDATKKYSLIMSDLIKCLTKGSIKLNTPFIDISRKEVLKRGYKIDQEIINRTQTCYIKDGGCNICPHCKLKAEMVKKLSI